MNKIIYKYPISGLQAKYLVPKGAKVLSVQHQERVTQVWMEIPCPEADKECREFFMVPTGQMFDADKAVYLATVQEHDGFVGHVYERVCPGEKPKMRPVALWSIQDYLLAIRDRVTHPRCDENHNSPDCNCAYLWAHDALEITGGHTGGRRVL